MKKKKLKIYLINIKLHLRTFVHLIFVTFFIGKAFWIPKWNFGLHLRDIIKLFTLKIILEHF